MTAPMFIPIFINGEDALRRILTDVPLSPTDMSASYDRFRFFLNDKNVILNDAVSVPLLICHYLCDKGFEFSVNGVNFSENYYDFWNQAMTNYGGKFYVRAANVVMLVTVNVLMPENKVHVIMDDNGNHPRLGVFIRLRKLFFDEFRLTHLANPASNPAKKKFILLETELTSCISDQLAHLMRWKMTNT